MRVTRGQFEATVAANVPLCREHFKLVLRVKSFPPTEPGQFIQVQCNNAGPAMEFAEHVWEPGEKLKIEGEELLARSATLRRPFSLAGRRDLPGDVVELDLIHRVVGVGTDWLSHLKAGDAVSILGPLGNRFKLPPAGGIALMVGGGVGIPPMIYLAEKWAGRKGVVFAGSLSRELLALTITDDSPPPTGDVDPLYNIAEFNRHGIPTVITTDDGSYGFRGYVTQALEIYLDRLGAKPRSSAGYLPGPPSAISVADAITIYTCGPEPMMRRVAGIAAERGIHCQVAIERAMACGMGTCQSCCIKIKKPDRASTPMPGNDWAWRLACTDGPVFSAVDLIW